MNGIDKFYEKFITEGSSGIYTDTGSVKDLNLLEINDNLLKNREKVLARPILSLEGVGLTINSQTLEALFLLDRVCVYYAGLFKFSDDHFNRVKLQFIRAWLFGELYIGYGDGYINEELRVLEIGRTSGLTKLFKGDIFPKCKYRLYTPEFNGDEVKWTSLISGIKGHNFQGDNLVKCAFGGKALWLQWFDLCREIVALERAFVQLSRLSVTKVKASVAKSDDFVNELQDILGWSYVLTQSDRGVTNDIEPIEFCEISAPSEFLNGAYLYIAQKMNRLGMVSSSEQKAERMTTGEHYKDLKFASNTEAEMLDNLLGNFAELNERFNLEVPIKVSLTSALNANGAPKTTFNPFNKFNKYNDEEEDKPEAHKLVKQF